MFWLAVLVSAVVAAWVIARALRSIREREQAAEARAASLLAGVVGTAAAPATPAAQPVRAAAVVDDLAQQKLLFESAHKAGAAGEPALAIQLYARLLARYPTSGFADQARAGAEALKNKPLKG